MQSRYDRAPNKEYHPSLSLLDDAQHASGRSEKDIGGLGLEILWKGGNIAKAMQSMLMSIVLAGYQRYVVTEVTAGTNFSREASRSDFVSVQVPGEMAGLRASRWR